MTYVRKNQINRKRWIFGLSLFLLSCIGAATYMLIPEEKEIPVFQEEFVLELPVFEPISQQPVQPYESGNIAISYFNGTIKDVASVIEYEGVYRPSQGVVITKENLDFEIYAAMDGEVIAVKNDMMLGDAIQIQSDEYVITYQCISDIQVEEGMTVKQHDYLGKASSNMYLSELGNHLNLIVEKNGKIIDPELLIPLY